MAAVQTDVASAAHVVLGHERLDLIVHIVGQRLV